MFPANVPPIGAILTLSKNIPVNIMEGEGVGVGVAVEVLVVLTVGVGVAVAVEGVEEVGVAVGVVISPGSPQFALNRLTSSFKSQIFRFIFGMFRTSLSVMPSE